MNRTQRFEAVRARKPRPALSCKEVYEAHFCPLHGHPARPVAYLIGVVAMLRIHLDDALAVCLYDEGSDELALFDEGGADALRLIGKLKGWA